MTLVLGPPASGKTSYCLDRVRSHISAGDRDWRLLVPTATMAEHLRNQLAREGFAFAPTSISTLAKFVDGLAADLSEASAAALEIVTSDVLERACPAHYLSVRDFAGFRRAVASAIDEFTSAGGCAADIALTAGEFGTVLEGVLKSLRERGLYLQADRLRQAQPPAKRESFYLAGFYSFNNPELDFVRKLSAKMDVTVCLPEWAGSEAAIAALRSFAPEERRMDASTPQANRELVVAPSLDAELNEIARRMLLEKAAGRPWRDMGIIVRSEQPYVSALRTALDRFGIPVRFYFGTPLPAHPAIRFISGVVAAMLSRWDHAETLEVLRLPGSPLENDDRFDFAVRDQLPNSGLTGLKSLAAEHHSGFFENLDALSSWAEFPLTLASDWVDKFVDMASLFQAPRIGDGISHEDALLLRSQSAALTAWEESVTETAGALADSPVTCAQFFRALRTVLESRTLRPPDHRRDVVHVIDAFEARQWRLPVVFVCGLIEKQFPRYHTENPVLTDDVRRRLQARGIPLRTSIERQGDEQFLFDLALIRATSRLVLSYPVLNAKAESNLPSFFIERALPYQISESVEVRPAPLGARAAEPYAGIFDDDLRGELAKKYAGIAASAIETYLNCGYQFFGQQTLNLAESPSDPWDRLNPPVQGEIAHSVLERVAKERRTVREVFDTQFAEYCLKKRVPHGYRTEAIRLDLLHNLELIEREDRMTPLVESLYEKRFALSLGDGTVVRGRIDRIEVDSEGRATVVDYKYSGQMSIGRSKRGHDNQTHVQGGLYMLALPGLGGYTPAGMVYCGFKREVNYGGWILKPHFIEVREGCDQERLDEVMRLAKEAALQAMASIRAGIIKPAPADEARCQFCSLSAMCRLEKAAAVADATAGAGD